MNQASVRTFACPVHKTAFVDGLFCPSCNKAYPEANGIPVLINEANSVFLISDYLTEKAYGGASSYAGSLDNITGLRKIYRRAMRYLSESAPMKEFSINDAVEAVLSAKADAEILVIGAGDTSIRGNATYTDVAFGANVHCIADAHDLPFPERSFDACIAVAVLEHVAAPYRCVDEIMRVLRPGGYVYAETPFMQPVHMGAYDFTRFTYLGHRRLFRYFEEIHSGISGGPGTSAGQLIRYALTSVSDKPSIKKWLKLVGLVSTVPFRWLDKISDSNISAYDSASGFYFFGTLRQEPISDRQLLGYFRGG